MKLYIYGAKSIALGVCRGMQALYPSHPVEGFLVSSLEGNPTTLAGLSVLAIDDFSAKLSLEEKEQIHVLIATPENSHSIIINTLTEYGFLQYTCIDSVTEGQLMEAYFKKTGQFSSLHELPQGESVARLDVLAAKFHKDVVLQGDYDLPKWMIPIQVGAALTDERVAELQDSTGENISSKNVNYCELTALYWMWKNVLTEPDGRLADYYGLFHYRRLLDVSDDDIMRLKANDVDMILPFPMLHEPNAFEHHTRYVKDSDWDAMCVALEELQPEYANAMVEIFSQPYFYNYNMLIAKREVLLDYCEWLFPILERVEELSEPKGWERADRYIGYLGENLLTLYFMYNEDKYNIVHTGRRMLI